MSYRNLKLKTWLFQIELADYLMELNSRLPAYLAAVKDKGLQYWPKDQKATVTAHSRLRQYLHA